MKDIIKARIKVLNHLRKQLEFDLIEYQEKDEEEKIEPLEESIENIDMAITNLYKLI